MEISNNIKAQIPKSLQLIRGEAQKLEPSDKNNEMQEKIRKAFANNKVKINEPISLDLSKFSTENRLFTTDTSLSRSVTGNGSDIFLRKDSFKTADDAVYHIDGVDFSKAQVESIRNVMNTALSTIPVKGSNLNYWNYAEMGIAESAVSKWSSDNLDSSQSGVVNNALSNYLTDVIEGEQQTLDNQNAITDSNKYFGTRIKISADIINQMQDEISKVTGKYYRKHTEPVDAIVCSASNSAQISKVRELFASTDLNNADAVNVTYNKYRSIMKPAYTEYGINTNSSYNSVISQEIKGFAKQISNTMSVVNNIRSTGIDRVV